MFDSRSVLTCNYLVWVLKAVLLFFFLLSSSSVPFFARSKLKAPFMPHILFIYWTMKVFSLKKKISYICICYEILVDFLWHVRLPTASMLPRRLICEPCGILCRWVLRLFLMITFVLFELLRFKKEKKQSNRQQLYLYLCYCIQYKLHSCFQNAQCCTLINCTYAHYSDSYTV